MFECYPLSENDSGNKKGSDRKAVKIIREKDEERINVHRHEYELMSELNHKNVVKSHEFFVDTIHAEVKIVLDLVEG